MFKKNAIITLMICFALSSAFSLYRAPEGARNYYWLMSPDLLSLSMGFVGTDKPSGITVNSAGSAFIQNIKIEGSYLVAPGLWSQNEEVIKNASDFFSPFGANLGLSYPSRFGVFSGYLSYVNMSNEGFNSARTRDLDLGKTGSLYLAFAKDYNDNFAFGFSGNAKFSYNPYASREFFDVSAALDFALIFRPEWELRGATTSNWGLQNFQFSLLVKELGKPLVNFYASDNDLVWAPAPFTLGFGYSMNLYNNGSSHWKLLADLSTPFFQNMVFSLGTEVQILSFLALRGSYTFDLEGVLEYTKSIPKSGDMYNIYNFGGGLSFKFSSDSFKKLSHEEAKTKKHMTTEFSIDLGVRPYHNGMAFELGGVIQLGVKDTNPPVINYSVKNVYASPNFDGVQDTIDIALDIKDERYIRSWHLEIYDINNEKIRTIKSKEDRQETLSFTSVVKRYFKPKTGIQIPSLVSWDCRDDNGAVVADGTYTFKFFAMDDNKNTDPNGTAAGEIIIDTEKPEIKKVITNSIFSPGSGGSKDSLIIELDIIRDQVEAIELPLQINSLTQPSYIDEISTTINNEAFVQKWYVEIKNTAQKTVKTYQFNSLGTQKIQWDGLDNDGNKVPDGVYSILFHSIDAAGNYYEEVVSNIIVDTEPKPIGVTVNTNYFSPNGDGINDEVVFTFSIPVKEGIEKWELSIKDKNDKFFRSFSGEKQPPSSLVWNGENEKAQLAKEGEYQASLQVLYENGTTSLAHTPSLFVDITKPDAKVLKYTKAFSPNGDGVIDEAIIEHTSSLEDDWKGIITDEAGRVVKTYLWKSQLPPKFTWDGRADSGSLLPDGQYFYSATSTDRAGNTFVMNKMPITIDTGDVPLFITAIHGSFSPNGDGIKDNQSLEVRMNTEANANIGSWKLKIINDREEEVFIQNGQGSISSLLNWDGKKNDGKMSVDGNYYAKVEIELQSGVQAKAKSSFFSLDNLSPQLKIQAVNTVFSPNNDGNLDELTILQSGSKEAMWIAQIEDANNKVVWSRAYADSTPPQKEIWDGKDKHGNVLPNGNYTYTLKGADHAGNATSQSIKGIELKVVRTPAYLTLAENYFSPNNDGKLDTISFVPYVTFTDSVEAHTLEIFNEANELVRNIQASGLPPKEIIWDGKTSNGTVAQDGTYTGKLTVLYAFGNKPEAHTSSFILDTKAPEFSLHYSPETFSPDNDGVDDEVTIHVDAKDMTGIKNWKITIINPMNNREFIAFSGKGAPTTSIQWNGVGSNGELVESAEDYPVRVQAEDFAGNVLDTMLNPLPVDILVIRLNDGRLRIKISNIEFKPNLASMTDSTKNQSILVKLARALKKYAAYTITIEGHAHKPNNQANAIQAKTLSDERAKAISQKLKTMGIQQSRMNTIGKGFDELIVPLAPGTDDNEYKKNRRVEFYLEK